MGRIITLLSDFGLRDPYVSAMKAVLLSKSPTSTIVDISHDVEKYNVMMGSFILASVAAFFPKATVHLAVVDPEVGGSRRPIIIETKSSLLVGPDNGLLIRAADIQGLRRVFEIKKVDTAQSSSTFHGRDIFSPVAAMLAEGEPPEGLGREVTNFSVPAFSHPLMRKEGATVQVIYVDSFGSLITNLHASETSALGFSSNSHLDVRFRGKRRKIPFAKTYSDVPKGTLLALVGSHNFMEIAVNQGNASRRLGLREGSELTVFRG